MVAARRGVMSLSSVMPDEDEGVGGLQRAPSFPRASSTAIIIYNTDDDDEGVGGLQRHPMASRAFPRSLATPGSTSIQISRRLFSSMPVPEDDSDDEDANAQQEVEEVKPYQGAYHSEALPEIFLQDSVGSSSSTMEDEHLWVPQTDKVSFKPLCLSVSGGYYTNLLRVKGSGLLSRHRHPGPIHAHVVKGRWRYLEHDWEAVEGSYVFEPPGDIHTLIVPEGVDEMITFFHVTGAVMYCDEHGEVNGYDDVFTKMELAKAHYQKVGLGEDYIKQFLR